MQINYSLILADDYCNYCLFFREVLDELPIKTTLHRVTDGVNLMQYLNYNLNQLPQVLFLDLNMPLKKRTECLKEIKNNQQLDALKVIITSTSINLDIVNVLYQNGADYYICITSEFSKLKHNIHQSILKTSQDIFQKPSRQDFVIN